MLEDSRAVLGVAAVSGHVYVVRAESPEVEVYSAVTLSFQRRLPVAGLRAPTDIAACEAVGCLFVADWPECRIHRVSVQACRPGNTRTAVTSEDCAEKEKMTIKTLEAEENWKDEETGWSTTERPWSLSLVERQRQCTLLVTCDQVNLIMLILC